MTSGVYSLAFQNGWCYIGSSRDIVGRVRVHKSSLRRGNHYNKHMQRCWNKYGDFELVILEECGQDREALLEAEQRRIDARPKKLLNGSRVAAYPEGTPEVLRGRSERAKAQHAQGKLGFSTWTEEGLRSARAKTGAALRGRKQNPVSVAKMRKSCKERWTPELREQQRQRANLQFRKRQARIFGLEVPT